MLDKKNSSSGRYSTKVASIETPLHPPNATYNLRKELLAINS